MATEQKKISDFKSVVISVRGMTCSSCASRIEKKSKPRIYIAVLAIGQSAAKFKKNGIIFSQVTI